MKPAGALAGLVLMAAVSAALAHAHLLEATPADGSVISAAPTKLALRFSEDARLTALSIEKSGAGSQKLAPLPQQPQSKIVVPLPALAPGHYLVSWRALSADGHVVAGQLHFTLNQ
jgi:methionine-rich copper-binding protein CopC